MGETSKDKILASLRSTSLDDVPLPQLDGPWTVYDDPRQQFMDAVVAVGGQVTVIANTDDLNAELDKITAYREAREVCSLIEGVGKANVDLDAVEDPHELESVDFFIAPGRFGVAENGAIWIADCVTRPRIPYFINQHMALVIPADEVVNNMHEAYERLTFTEPGFGVFLAGPSKTADIEQSLVIGAHGARSLTVFLMEGSDGR
jgi:L-lactate dehydrogenase complex protein LldG